MDNIPILTDTEPETSMEQDAEVINAITTQNVTNCHTKSLFNITLDNFEHEEKHESVEFKDYETRLHQEMKDWKTLLHNAYIDLKQSKQKHPVIDKSILPPEKRKYLENAPCLQSFIRESVEFRQQAHIFLELDYAELMEMVNNLVDLCEHRVNVVKVTKLVENLANYKKSSNWPL